MKTIAELIAGDSFYFIDDYFIVTSDFKMNGNKLCYSLKTGQPQWFETLKEVDNINLYFLDKENNITPIKTI